MPKDRRGSRVADDGRGSPLSPFSGDAEIQRAAALPVDEHDSVTESTSIAAAPSATSDAFSAEVPQASASLVEQPSQWELQNPLEMIKHLEKQLAETRAHHERSKAKYETALKRAKVNLSSAMEKIADQSGRLRDAERRIGVLDVQVQSQGASLESMTAAEEVINAFVFAVDPNLHQCVQRLRHASATGKKPQPVDNPDALAREYAAKRDQAIVELLKTETQRAAQRGYADAVAQLAPGGSRGRRSKSSVAAVTLGTLTMTGSNTSSAIVRRESMVPNAAHLLGHGHEQQPSISSTGVADGADTAAAPSEVQAAPSPRSVNFTLVGPDAVPGAQHAGKVIAPGLKLSDATSRDFRRVSLSEFGLREQEVTEAKSRAKFLQAELSELTTKFARRSAEADRLKEELQKARVTESKLRDELRIMVQLRLHQQLSASGALTRNRKETAAADAAAERPTLPTVAGDATNSSYDSDALCVRNRQASPSSSTMAKLPSLSRALVARGGATSMTAPTKGAGLTPRAPQDPVPPFILLRKQQQLHPPQRPVADPPRTKTVEEPQGGVDGGDGECESSASAYPAGAAFALFVSSFAHDIGALLSESTRVVQQLLEHWNACHEWALSAAANALKIASACGGAASITPLPTLGAAQLQMLDAQLSRIVPSFESLPELPHEVALPVSSSRTWKEEEALLRHVWLVLVGFLQQLVSHVQLQISGWHTRRDFVTTSSSSPSKTKNV